MIGTIDTISIYSDEDGFHLAIYTDEGERHTYRIGLPDTFKYEVDRTIGAWLAEGEAARGNHWQQVSVRNVKSGGDVNVSVSDYDLARDIERGK